MAAELSRLEAPYDLVRTMRASILVLGPLVARFGKARVSLPGGCAIGARPVNLHLMGLERMGARCEVVHGYVEASAERLRGAYILMDTVTVTGTENLMMAGCLAEGETVLDNAACEPEVVRPGPDAADDGRQDRGRWHADHPRPGGAQPAWMPPSRNPGQDRGGHIRSRGSDYARRRRDRELRAGSSARAVSSNWSGRERMWRLDGDTVRVRGREPIRSVDVTTNPYPGFATDMQAQYMALMTQGDGTAVITETIFENRFMHALELIRMGADITIEGRQAIVRGGKPLTGANLIASDLRASASLILAGLVAQGETVVDRVYHLDRGYHRIEEKLAGLGAVIERIGR